MSHRSVQAAFLLASLSAVLVAASAFAKTSAPSVAFVWSGNHGDVISQANPAYDSSWATADGITDGTFGVAVYWPGQHIRSAHLQRNGGYGDWGAWSGNAYYFALGVSTLPTSPLINNGDTSFDVAADSRGWATFWLHADNYAEAASNQFARGDRFQLEVCTGPNMDGQCALSPWITIRG